MLSAGCQLSEIRQLYQSLTISALSATTPRLNAASDCRSTAHFFIRDPSIALRQFSFTHTVPTIPRLSRSDVISRRHRQSDFVLLICIAFRSRSTLYPNQETQSLPVKVLLMNCDFKFELLLFEKKKNYRKTSIRESKRTPAGLIGDKADAARTTAKADRARMGSRAFRSTHE